MTSSRPSRTTKKMTGNILYHGSLQIVEQPLVDIGRSDLDFGQGFYTTDIKEQAAKWAKTLQSRKRKKDTAYVNIYQFDKQAFDSFNYKVLRFESYNLEWLEFICQSRQGNKPWKGYDLIEGGIANDSVIDTVEAYMTGIMDADKALGRLTFYKPNNQICILNQGIIDRFFIFKGYIEI